MDYGFVLEKIFVTLEHKSSLKSLGYIYSNSQQWVKMGFLFYAKNH